MAGPAPARLTPYAEALDRALRAARERGRRPFQTVPLKAAVGRVAAGAVTSGEDLPAFDNSAMDGFALAAASTARACAERPVTLPVAAVVAAGDVSAPAPASAAVEIMTGAPIPAGCDAVVRMEDVERLEDGRGIRLRAPAVAGDFVRRRGDDMRAGAPVLRGGEALEPRHILALAALGVSRVPVRWKPKVALVSTGKEIVAFEQCPGSGRLRNATAPYLSAALEEAGAQLVAQHSVGDEPAEFRGLLERMLEQDVDVILATGAVSMGRHDFVAAVVAELGAELLFHGVATRPGKPALAASLGQGPLFFGLPGNPLSTVVALRFLVLPVLRELLGQPPEQPQAARLAAALEKPEGLRCFLKARRRADSGAVVDVLPGQASFQIQPLLEADCWAVAPEAGARLEAGSMVEVWPL